MSSCPLRCATHILSQWWSVRPLFLGVRQLRRFFGEEDLRRSAINALGLKPGDRVLNMCAGLGDNLRLLIGPDIELFAADADRDNAEACRREIRENRWHNIRALHWNGYQLPFEDASFDAVFITYGFTGAEHPDSIIAECARLLKPGGRIAVIDWITPGKGNGIIAGLLWPLHFLMGCNPYTPWRRQLAVHFEICKQQKIWADMASFIYGQKRQSPLDGSADPCAGLEFSDEQQVSRPQPSNAFCGMQYAQAHERVHELREARRAEREAQRAAARQEAESEAGRPNDAAADAAETAAAEETAAPQAEPEKPKAAAPQPAAVQPGTDSNAAAVSEPAEDDDSAETDAEDIHALSRDKKFRYKKRKNR